MVYVVVMGIMDGLEKTGNFRLVFWSGSHLWTGDWQLSGRFPVMVLLADSKKHDDRSCSAGVFLADGRSHWKWGWMVVSDFRLLSWMGGKSVVFCHGECIERII